MAKQVRVVEVAYKWSQPEFTPAKVKGYLTDTAGLAVCHTHKLKVDRRTGISELLTLPSWDIITYPFGEPVAQGFRTKTEALEAVRDHLHKFSWVCIFKQDFEKNNDMDAVRKAILEVRKVYGL